MAASNIATTFSAGTLCNLTRPDKSRLLRAPLAKKSGGLGLCAPGVFADTKDQDYQKLLAAILATAKEHNEKKRFDMPGFRPNKHYIREMQRFGGFKAHRPD